MNDTALDSVLLPLVEERKRQGKIRDEAEKECDRLSAEIAVLLIAAGHDKYSVGDWKVSVSDRSRDTISRDLLVELGVGTDVIAAATKKSPFTVVDIRASKKQEAA
jgi:hypothetical protein